MRKILYVIARFGNASHYLFVRKIPYVIPHERHSCALDDKILFVKSFTRAIKSISTWRNAHLQVIDLPAHERGMG